MKERYIRQVRRSLRLPHKAKEAVARDLTEIFDSALEHGETEQAVVKRLGTAQEFAAEAEKQLRDGGGAHWRWGEFLTCLVAVAVSITAFGACAIAKADKRPVEVIGGAESLTNIRLEAAYGVDISAIIFAFGMIAAAIAAAQIIRTVKRSRRAI